MPGRVGEANRPHPNASPLTCPQVWTVHPSRHPNNARPPVSGTRKRDPGTREPTKENPMTSTINNNVRMPRKMLATEIDRLDALLDGLAENLNEAVAMAVKDTVAQVVR